MAEKFYRTKKFLELQKVWSEKLINDGFEDIEFNCASGESSRFIKPALGTTAWPIDQNKSFARYLYYQMASKFLWDYQFKKERHREIWRLHSMGYSQRQINLALGDEGNSGRVVLMLRPVFYEYMRQMLDWEQNGEE